MQLIIENTLANLLFDRNSSLDLNQHFLNSRCLAIKENRLLFISRAND